jgi:hypothetical protein
MSFEKGDSVRLQDKHSEHDGEVGEVTQVSETMFGDETYTVQFDGGQEAGLPADALEAAADESDDETDESEDRAEASDG